MTEVVKFAHERRRKFQYEVAKLDDFLRMADALMRGASNRAQAPASAPTPAPPKPAAAAWKAPARPAEHGQTEPQTIEAKDVLRLGTARQASALN